MADQGQLDNIDLTPAQLKEVKRLLHQHLPNTQVWAYGSRVTFKSRPESDLDLVAFATKEQSRAVGDLREALEESDLPFSVDIMVWDTMPEHFKPNIEQAYFVLQKCEKELQSNRSWVNLGQAATLAKETVNPQSIPADRPYIGLEHIESEQLRLRSIGKASEVTSTKQMFLPGDILFGKLRPYFRKVISPNETGICSTDIWVLRPKDGFDKKFLFYWCATWDFVNHVNAASEGTRMPRAKWDVAITHKIPRFNIAEQQAIAHILGALDDKIELNHKMNQTLEDIAKAIFKSWFIDFDPVHAKAEGRPTGLPPEISDLFPDELVRSNIREIPKGWEKSVLGDLVTPKRGQTITKNKCIVGTIPVVAGGLEPAYFHNIPNVKAPVVTVSASGANAGYARLYHQDIWASDCSFISENQSTTPYLWYVFLKLNQDNIYHMQQGAAQPHVYPSDLMRLEICVSPNNLLWKKLNELVSPNFQRIGLSVCENKALAELRDTLLSKLISGELRIPDAEKFLEQAGL